MYMKQMIVGVALVVVVVVAALISVNGQSSTCNVSMSDLLTCKPAVTPPNPTPPSQQCCSVLSHADLPCLCSYKNSPLLPSLGIDPKLALQLPAKCNLPHPPNC